MISLIDTNSNPDPIAYPIPGNDDAAKSIRLVTSIIADAVIEGRKKFLSYLSESGMALKKEKEAELGPAVLPEEEVKIKEIEEIVEDTEPLDETGVPLKKGRSKPAAEDKNKIKRKV